MSLNADNTSTSTRTRKATTSQRKEHSDITNVICNDLDAAAKFILENSFAILRVNDETHKALTNSWIAAKYFLTSKVDQSPRQEATTKSKYRRIRNGALMGYNRPSETKVLFRSMFVNGEPDPAQPWGDDEAFKVSSSLLGQHLHSILLGCLEEMMKLVKERNYTEAKGRQPDRHASAKKKRKLDHSNSINGLDFDFDSTPCPLDYFLYHNQSDGVNCSEHVDRGVLICISLTNVAGLEVFSNDAEDGNWSCPEHIFINEQLYQEREVGCSNMLCILSGDQLKKVLQGDDNMTTQFRGLNACIHRVKRKLSAARLSISYELRASVRENEKKLTRIDYT